MIDLVTHGAEQVLVTETIAGTSAVDEPWLGHAAATCAALGAGLRALHDALPVEDCPWTWSIDDRLPQVSDVGTRHELELARPQDDLLVVCHGDACAPNTLIGSDGRASGHVDLGSLGVADRWADITVLAMSTGWNYGAEYTRAVLDGYGIEADPERMAYYRRLWIES